MTEREDMEKAFPPMFSNLNLVVVAGYGPVEIPPVYAFRAVKVHGNQGFFRMVGRQVDKVILFPSKQGSKCGKMDKKEMPDAEALTPPRPAFCLWSK